MLRLTTRSRFYIYTSSRCPHFPDIVPDRTIHSEPFQIQNSSPKLSDSINYEIHKLSAERIVELAHWAQLEQSPKWLSRVAYILLRAGQNKEAVIFAERSVAIGTEDAGLVADLAVSYAANNQYQKAIDTILLCQELISDSNDALRRVNIIRISQYQEKLGDIDAAIESYTHALDGLEEPKVPVLAQGFLRLLLTHRKYDRALQIVGRLSKAEDMGADDSTLAEFFYGVMLDADFHKQLIRLAVETNDLGTVAEFYRRGFRAFKRIDISWIKPAFLYCYGVLHLRLFQQDKAVRLLEVVANDPRLPLVSKRYGWMRSSAESILAIVYLDRALTAQRFDNVQTATEVFGRLTELAQHERAAKNNFLPALILGVWHRINGRTKAARACIRGSVMLGIGLLTDDTDENDSEGWLTLNGGLLAAGDGQNAPMVASYNKLLNMKSAAAGRIESYGCDGCDTEIQASQEMYSCSYCLNVDFCGDCYELHTTGNLPINICGRHHEFIHVPAVLEPYPPGMLKAGDVYRETSVWLEELREAWAATD